MREAFSNAGPLTKRLTLNQAVTYTLEHMEYVNGFGYFISPQDPVYDTISASGKITLGLENEDAKAEKIIEYAAKHFPNLPTNRIIHMGDTFGDSGGILGIAKAGGIGIAFNYNQILKDFLKNKIKTENIPNRIYFIDSKDKGKTNLENVVECIKTKIS